MTGNFFFDLAVAILAIAIMAGLARHLFSAPPFVLSRASAAERLEFDEPDFTPIDWLIDPAAGAALARNDAGEIALICIHGDGLISRRFAPGLAPVSYDAGRLHLMLDEPSLKRAEVHAAEAEAQCWLEAGQAGAAGEG